jgi:hypothetical protein
LISVLAIRLSSTFLSSFPTKVMVLKTLLNRIKERNFRGIAKQTELLDSQTRQNLQQFLEDVPQEQQELKDLEEDLFKASIKLKELNEKEEFIGTRLSAYQEQLNRLASAADASLIAESVVASSVSSNSETNPESDADTTPAAAAAAAIEQEQRTGKQQEQLKMLKNIELVHGQMVTTIDALKVKIESMERRKLELQWHLEECQVVLKKTEDIEKQETELALEEVVGGRGNEDTSDTPTTDASTTVEQSSKQQDDEVDEEIGTPRECTETTTPLQDEASSDSATTENSGCDNIATTKEKNDEELGAIEKS